MKTHHLRIRSLIPLFVGALSALTCIELVEPAAAQTQLQTLLTADFERQEELSGIGLVTGLLGTGDAKGNLAAASLYAQRLADAGFGDEPLEAISRGEGVALVLVTAQLPQVWSEGMEFDCEVGIAGGGATSLVGGRLWTTPLKRAMSGIFRDANGNALDFDVVAFAGGQIEVRDPDGNPTNGVTYTDNTTYYNDSGTYYVDLGCYLRFRSPPRGAGGENLVINKSFRRRFFG